MNATFPWSLMESFVDDNCHKCRDNAHKVKAVSLHAITPHISIRGTQGFLPGLQKQAWGGGGLRSLQITTIVTPTE